MRYLSPRLCDQQLSVEVSPEDVWSPLEPWPESVSDYLQNPLRRQEKLVLVCASIVVVFRIRVSTDSGNDLKYSMLSDTPDSYSISTYVPDGSKSIKIYGADVVPEFPFAAVIAVVGIGSVVVTMRIKHRIL